jgi:hypothetical protein
VDYIKLILVNKCIQKETLYGLALILKSNLTPLRWVSEKVTNVQLVRNSLPFMEHGIVCARACPL